MTNRIAVPRKALTIAELTASDMPPLMALWPDLGRLLGLSESGTFEHAKAGRLPVELIRIGRKRWCRTADVLTWLHLPQYGNDAEAATSTSLAGTHHSNLSDQ